MNDPATSIDQRDTTRSAKPFLIAAAIAVLAVLTVVILGVTRPAENNLTDPDRVAIAARNFATARSDSDAERRKTTECAGFDEKKSPLGADSAGKKAEIAGVDAVHIDGDHATASVTSRIDGREAAANWNFSRENGTWLVCGNP
ncbi:Rv0361 family membrane protein [Nocardia africana]